MSAVPTRGNRNGRAVKVLVFLDQQKAPVTVGEIIRAVDPTCKCALMYGTLSTLQRRNKITTQQQNGRNAFRIVPGALINQRTGTRLDNPPVPVKVAARTLAAQRRAAKAKALARALSTTPAISAPANARQQVQTPVKQRAPSRRQKSEHAAFLITPNSILHQVTNAHGGAYLAAKRIASAVLSADLAAFEAHGGKVEKLANGAASRPLSFSYRDQAQNLTQLHNAASKRAKNGFKKRNSNGDTADNSED